MGRSEGDIVGGAACVASAVRERFMQLSLGRCEVSQRGLVSCDQ